MRTKFERGTARNHRTANGVIATALILGAALATGCGSSVTTSHVAATTMPTTSAKSSATAPSGSPSSSSAVNVAIPGAPQLPDSCNVSPTDLKRFGQVKKDLRDIFETQVPAGNRAYKAKDPAKTSAAVSGISRDLSAAAEKAPPGDGIVSLLRSAARYEAQAAHDIAGNDLQTGGGISRVVVNSAADALRYTNGVLKGGSGGAFC